MRIAAVLALCAALLLFVITCARVLTELGEVSRAIGTFADPDSVFSFGGLSDAYRAWHAIGLIGLGLTTVAMLVWLGGARRARGEGGTTAGGRPGFTLKASLWWIALAFGTAISAVGYQLASGAAEDWSRGESTATAMDSIALGALVDLAGSLIVLLGAVLCASLVRSRSQRIAMGWPSAGSG